MPVIYSAALSNADQHLANETIVTITAANTISNILLIKFRHSFFYNSRQ